MNDIDTRLRDEARVWGREIEDSSRGGMHRPASGRVHSRRRPARWVPPLGAASVVVIVALTTALLVGAHHRRVANPASRSMTATAASVVAPATGPVVVRIQLERTSVIAGDPIHVQVDAINTTGKTIFFPRNCGGGIPVFVGVGSVNVPFGHPAMALCLTAARPELAPGDNRLSVTVETTYQSCTRGSGSTSTMPTCGSGTHLMPALPAGDYLTKVYFDDLPAGSQLPNPVKVTLTAR